MYILCRPKYQRTGGICWTWQSIFSLDLFRREGVMFSGRLLSTNFTQFTLTPFILIVGIIITDQTFKGGVEQIESFLSETLGIEVELDESLTDYQLFTDFRSSLTAAFAAGTCIAFLTALTIALTVLPSSTSTILKFRSGVIPFASDPLATMLRIAPDQTACLRGIMFWGTLYASLMAGGVVAFVIFMFSWHETTALAQWFLAMVLGMEARQLLESYLPESVSPTSVIMRSQEPCLCC